MGTELHIRFHQDVAGEPDDLLSDFPFEPGQSIVSYLEGLIVIDLGDADDTNYMQDWYLNRNDDVMSYYVVEE